MKKKGLKKEDIVFCEIEINDKGSCSYHGYYEGVIEKHGIVEPAATALCNKNKHISENGERFISVNELIGATEINGFCKSCISIYNKLNE